MAAEFNAVFRDLLASKQPATVVGRILVIRAHGGMTFVQVEDESGRVQVAIKKDAIGDALYNQFQDLYDRGDFIEVTGTAYLTKTEEPTILADSYRLVTKSLLPLPEKWHGLTDTEVRYRKRYLDLIMNPEVRARMMARSKMVSAIRNFFDDRGFVEVETPTLQPIYGGGFARPFKTHHNALNADFFLRISDEMYLKRCLVGGIEKVYEITKVFRNEGIDRDHNPEFTMLEAQVAYEDYRYGMDIFEELFESVALSVLKTTEIAHDDVVINVRRPWKRYRLVEAVQEIGGVDPTKWKNVEVARKELAPRIPAKKRDELLKFHTLGELTAFAFEELVEEKLIQPTIIYDYPIEVSPLAKRCEDPAFTQRFEAFILGSEVGNNYSELNDPVDLEKRFIEEKRKEEAGFDEAHQTDNDYLEAIKHGMPPACGLGVGIDRMMMMMTGAANIKEVLLFPTLRPEGKSEVQAFKRADDIFGAIKQKLESKKIAYVTKHHGDQPEDSDRAMGFDPALRPHHQGAKAIVVKGKKSGTFFHFVLPDDCKLDQKKVQALIGERWSFASREEVIEVTGCIPGSVPPFGSVLGLQTRVDKHLLENKEIFFNAGSLTDSIRMNLEDYLKAEVPEEVDAAE